MRGGGSVIGVCTLECTPFGRAVDLNRHWDSFDDPRDAELRRYDIEPFGDIFADQGLAPHLGKLFRLDDYVDTL